MILKDLTSVLGFQLVWSKLQANRDGHLLLLTFFSLACKFTCNSLKCTYGKTITNMTGHSCCGICFHMWAISLERLLEGRVVRILWPESQSLSSVG